MFCIPVNPGPYRGCLTVPSSRVKVRIRVRPRLRVRARAKSRVKVRVRVGFAVLLWC